MADMLSNLQEIADKASEGDKEWPAFFVEAQSMYLVGRREPKGYVAEAQADDLIGKITHDGRIETALELELLVKTLELATSVPEKLITFALEAVKQMVISNDGPTRHDEAKPGVIMARDVTYLPAHSLCSRWCRPDGHHPRRSRTAVRSQRRDH